MTMPSHWNYRVVDHEKGEALVLCEVYYEGKKIVGYCPLNRSPLGSSIEDWGTKAARTEAMKQLTNDLKLMRQALKSPVLKLSKLSRICNLPRL